MFVIVKSNPLSYTDPLGLVENACTPTPQAISSNVIVVAAGGYLSDGTLAGKNIFPISILPNGTIYFPISGPGIPPGYVYVPGGMGPGSNPGGTIPTK